jgi:PAS domain S-box-containing protein
MWIRELVQEPTFRRAPAALKAGLLSALAFPIKAGELVLGVMEFFSRDNQEPDPDLLDCTAYVGNQIGQFYERGRAQEELHRFRAAMDASADMIVLIDRATMRFVDVNLTACRLLGYSREELLTMGPQDVLPESREELERAYDEFISNPSNVTGMRSCYRCKNGTTIPFESTRRVLRSGDSYIIAAISRDIRERIAAEAALRESNERFRALTQLSSDWYWEQDAEFRFTRFEGQRVANPDKGMVAGFMGKRRWELDHEVEGGWDAHRALLEAHQPFRDVVINSPLPDGGRRYVSISGEPMYAADGRFMGYRGVGQDITERKRDEERIRYLADALDPAGAPLRPRLRGAVHRSRSVQGHQRYVRPRGRRQATAGDRGTLARLRARE